MDIHRVAVTQAAVIVLVGYVLWMGIPTVVGNTFGTGAVPVILPVVNVFAAVVPVLAGFRAARLAGARKPANAVIGAVSGVLIILLGITVLAGASVSVKGYLSWCVGGGMLAWLGAIVEPHVPKRHV